MAITFSVSDVKPETHRIATAPVAESIDILASGGAIGDQGQDDHEIGDEWGIEPVRSSAPPPEAHSEHPGGVIPALYHPFAAAALHAFDAHYPLVLSPDQVWILLAPREAVPGI